MQELPLQCYTYTGIKEETVINPACASVGGPQMRHMIAALAWILAQIGGTALNP